MQRRDPKTFLEAVLDQLPPLPGDGRAQLLELIAEKPGTKRAARIAALLAGEEEDDA